MKFLAAVSFLAMLPVVVKADDSYTVELDFSKVPLFSTGSVRINGEYRRAYAVGSTVRTPVNSVLAVKIVRVNPNFTVSLKGVELALEGEKFLDAFRTDLRSTQPRTNAENAELAKATEDIKFLQAPDKPIPPAERNPLVAATNLFGVSDAMEVFQASAEANSIQISRTAIAKVYNVDLNENTSSYKAKLKELIDRFIADRDLVESNIEDSLTPSMKSTLTKAYNLTKSVNLHKHFDDDTYAVVGTYNYGEADLSIDIITKYKGPPSSRQFSDAFHRVVFRAVDRARSRVSYGFAYDSLVSDSYSLIEGVAANTTPRFRLDTRNTGSLNLATLYHIPFGSGREGDFAGTLGLGVKSDTTVRTFAGLTYFAGKEGSLAFTIGLAFGMVDRPNVDNPQNFTGSQVPLRSVQRSALFFGITFRN